MGQSDDTCLFLCEMSIGERDTPCNRRCPLAETAEERAMRRLPKHEVNPTGTDHVDVRAIDEPDPNAGDACHEYHIEVLDRSRAQAAEDAKEGMLPADLGITIHFQHGPLKEVGPNGITERALLAILLDRYRAFQRSKWSSRENACTITKLEEALMWQDKRTLDRIHRGVEGTNRE